jgi:hypothetical protein
LNTNPFQEAIKKCSRQVLSLILIVGEFLQQAGSLMNLDSWGILSNYSFLISMI